MSFFGNEDASMFALLVRTVATTTWSDTVRALIPTHLLESFMQATESISGIFEARPPLVEGV